MTLVCTCDTTFPFPMAALLELAAPGFCFCFCSECKMLSARSNNVQYSDAASTGPQVHTCASSTAGAALPGLFGISGASASARGGPASPPPGAAACAAAACATHEAQCL